MSAVSSRAMLYFGKVITSDLSQAVKVSVDKYVMDERLTMYFKEKMHFYAYDESSKCKEGDYVTIREIVEPEDKKITHRVEKLVYELGNFIDPLSGRRCAGTEYIDDIQRISELFGKELPYVTS